MNSAPPSAARPGWFRLLPGLSLLQAGLAGGLRRDLLAGISVCIVMVPSVIAYAGLLGIPPEHGCYAALIPLLVYPLFGSSRQMIVGPDIAISLLMAGAIGPLAGGDARRAAALAAMLAIAAGLMLWLGARARIGVVAEFLSKPVLVGYMTGAALILMASQWSKLFGVTLVEADFFPRLFELVMKLPRTHGPTLALGIGLILVLALWPRFARRVPAALAVCVLAGLSDLGFGLDRWGVGVVGTMPGGLPGFAWPAVGWPEFKALLPAATGIALLIYTEGILLARAFGARSGGEVNPNQELVALGLANVATGLFQGFAVTGSQSRTTINDANGARSPWASFAAAGTLLLFLGFLTPLLRHLPEVALAAILIHAAFGLIEFELMRRIYRFYPQAALLAALTTLGVLVVGVVPGILVGVVVSLLGLLSRLSRPPDAVLRALPGHGFHDVGDEPAAPSVPGLIVYRFYAPLLFANATHFVTRVRELIAASPTSVRWFLLDAQAITDIDVTAAEALYRLQAELRVRRIALKVAHANRPLREVLERIGLAREVGRESFYPSVHECVAAFEAETSPRAN